MRAAGNPGVKEFLAGRRSLLRRTPIVRGWVVRPVDREDFEEPRRYRLDSELRGWGQRDFPRYVHTASPEPVDPPLDDRLQAELATALTARGVGV
jgi:hypothetical protein